MSGRLKMLFVTHTADPMGGAARSLRELLQAWDDVDADLMVHRANGLADDATLRAFFGPRIKRIFREWLAYDMCHRGRPSLGESPRRHLLFPVMWLAARRRFHRFIAREGYDAVHLNSVVLHPLVAAEQPFILHVREILDGEQPAAVASAGRASGTLFIDEATRAPFAGARLRASAVLNNPVDMRAVGHVPPRAAERLGGDPAALTIFGMVGTLIAEKGVDTVIDAFRRVEAADARLLIVGSGNADYTARLRAQSSADARIIFWGEEADVAAIFTLCDYVVRGEAYHCVGRTIYEALYAGCGAIVPGDPASHSFFEYDRFSERIAFYRPSDREALAQRFRERLGRKRIGKIGVSNVAQYAADFARFVREAIARRAV